MTDIAAITGQEGVIGQSLAEIREALTFTTSTEIRDEALGACNILEAALLSAYSDLQGETEALRKEVDRRFSKITELEGEVEWLNKAVDSKLTNTVRCLEANAALQAKVERGEKIESAVEAWAEATAKRVKNVFHPNHSVVMQLEADIAEAESKVFEALAQPASGEAGEK